MSGQEPENLEPKAAPSTFSSYMELTKPRLASLLVIVAFLSYFFAAGPAATVAGAATTFVVTLLLAAGIFALNHYIEREPDSLMVRTKSRPIPSGRVRPGAALAFGLVLLALCLVLALVLANLLTFLLCIAVAVTYLLIYTPLKYRTGFHTTLGAIPGAVPPLLGWAVAQNNLPVDALILFGILFLWQYPHFLSIEMIYVDDYRKANVKVLPITDPSGVWTAVQIVVSLILLVGVSVLPSITGLAGIGYGIAAVLSGIAFLVVGLRAVRTREKRHAKHLLRASVYYLPVVFLALLIPV